MTDPIEELKPFLRTDDRMLLRVILGLAILYALISVFVLTVANTDFDQGITLFLQRAQSPGLDALMEFVSWWASVPGACIVILGMSLIFALRKRYVEVAFMFAPLLSIPVISLIKRVVGRSRPTAELVRVARDFHNESFPSGHVVFYAVLFGFVTYLMYRHWTIPNWLRVPIAGLSVFLIVTVPFSRMYLGAHWFTDVTAGLALGCMLLIGLVMWYNRVIRGKRNSGRAAV
ncbi:phosphatase PAP2 family protein [Neolewinella antarctica]|uniref:Undecaprenyl-diphosphatase n=1 Tax=Neolewinella antarctica TaxID=442734 RepID=A0ABX0XC76_9BACT|nr:phosphatase PAP2 family protein [Neolewinella antarctica]NJC26860.1 undecaprenyl-diphosphatase [Neolewinella antarctica]